MGSMNGHAVVHTRHALPHISTVRDHAILPQHSRLTTSASWFQRAFPLPPALATHSTLLTFHSLRAILLPPRHDCCDCCRTDGGSQRSRTTSELSQNVDLFSNYLFIIKHPHVFQSLTNSANYQQLRIIHCCHYHTHTRQSSLGHSGQV